MPSVIQADLLKDASATKTLATLSSSAVTLHSDVSFPSGHVLQVLQTVKTDEHQITGVAKGDGTGKDSFVYIPMQGFTPSSPGDPPGAGEEFQQGITTTGSNKVLVQVSVNVGCNTIGYSNMVALFRGSAATTVIGSATKIASGTEVSGSTNISGAFGHYIAWSINDVGNISVTWLDSPGAGTHYYKLAWLGEFNKISYINRSGAQGNYAYTASTPSTITLMEVQV